MNGNAKRILKKYNRINFSVFLQLKVGNQNIECVFTSIMVIACIIGIHCIIKCKIPSMQHSKCIGNTNATLHYICAISAECNVVIKIHLLI